MAEWRLLHTRAERFSRGAIAGGCAVLALATALVWRAKLAVAERPAAVPGSASVVDVPADVAAVLKNRCVKCHGPGKHEANLNLSQSTAIAIGGDAGAVIVAGKPSESLLWQRIAADEMPEDRPLSADEKKTVEAWIAAGATGLPDRATAQRAASSAHSAADHWAFQPLARVPLPASGNSALRERGAIDRHLLSKLAAHQLIYAAEADRRTLLRRVSLVVVGLPPSPEEVAAFVADGSPDAYERVVDRLLASPEQAERAARHWLDAAGYADSNGYFAADSDRPLAYKYRDYVIRSLAADKPFDQFLTEQIAGDQLAGWKEDEPATPRQIELLTATHFLRNSQDGTGESDGNPDEQRADKFSVLEGTVQILGSSLFGLTVQCARCHDHKFEPFKQRDYYQLQAILYPAFNVEHWVKPNDRTVHAASAEATAAWRAASEPIDRQIAQLKSQLAAAEPDKIDKALPQEQRKALKASLQRVHKELEKSLAELKKARPERPGKLAVVMDVPGGDSPAYVLQRGVYNQRGDVALPLPPSVLCEPTSGATQTVAKTHGEVPPKQTRLAFARWLTAPGGRAEGIVARVTANRLWQHAFGQGLVTTPENLGLSAAPSVHRALVNHLAQEFVAGGWSLKRLERAMVASSAFRQSSRSAGPAAGDADNLLLSHYPLRRMDADSLRDAMLTTAGELDETRFGPYVPAQASAVGEVIVKEDAKGARRRSVYLQQRRTQMPSVLAVFDAPAVVINCTRRNTTTIPLQSLNLLNSDFVRRRAAALAERLIRAQSDPPRRVELAYQLVLGRSAGDNAAAAIAFIDAQAAAYPELKAPDERARAAWVDWCQTMLIASPALYIE
jgi:mono/diheme cytochrome c family protein